jgi:pyridoxal 5'-phosphate synthase pdxT subunit
VKTIGVLALQGDVREHRLALESVGASAISVRRAAELTALDGLVIPGGESTTMGKLIEAFELLDPLREAIKGGLPVYGSCAGMIMLADRVLDGASGQQTIGGMNVSVRRNAFGRQVDSFETYGNVPVLGEPDFPMVFIRAPWVEEVGSGVNVLATVAGEGGGSRIVAIEQGVLLATSFHPEVTTDTRFHRYFVEAVCSR